jgi:hypothetical protein
VVIVVCSPRICPAQCAEDYNVPLVRVALKEHLQGISFSFREKYVSRLGDRVSIALLKILDDGDLANPQMVRAVLRLVNQSFMYDNLISRVEDRKPKVTLFLLNHLLSGTRDSKLRLEISDLIELVKNRKPLELRK